MKKRNRLNSKKQTPNAYKHGKYCEGNKYYCKGCDKEITKQAKRCPSCAQIKRMKNPIERTKISKLTKEAMKDSFIRKKISLSHGGTGIPYENTEYGAEFDNALKEQVRFRDHYKCQICGCSQLENGRQLDVHHIDYDKENNKLNNLIGLCRPCHCKTKFNRDYWTKSFQILIRKI